MKEYPIPTKPGFYWAKWKIAEPPTYIDSVSGQEESIFLNGEWTVVEVRPNITNWDDLTPQDLLFDERFLVGVFRYETFQSLDCFFWGPGPLSKPS